MLSTHLTSQLDFACYVQVVANYVLAFDMAMQQDFDLVVLPPVETIDNFTTAEYVQMLTNAQDSYPCIIHTVAHDSASHVLGQTVRSAKTDGYMVNDLLAVFTLAANRKSSAVKEDKKRSRQELQNDVDVAPEQNHHQRSKLAQPAQRSMHQGAYPSSFPDARFTDEVAHLQYCRYWQWQWHLHYQTQVGQENPGFSPPRSIAASIAQNASHHYQDHYHSLPYPSHPHTFHPTHPASLLHAQHHTLIPRHPQPSLMAHNLVRDHNHSSVVLERSSVTSSNDLIPTTVIEPARADRRDSESSSLACTNTESYDSSADIATVGTSSNASCDMDYTDIDISDFDEYMFNI